MQMHKDAYVRAFLTPSLGHSSDSTNGGSNASRNLLCFPTKSTEEEDCELANMDVNNAC